MQIIYTPGLLHNGKKSLKLAKLFFFWLSKKAAVMWHFCLIGNIINNFLVPIVNESAPQEFHTYSDPISTQSAVSTYLHTTIIIVTFCNATTAAHSTRKNLQLKVRLSQNEFMKSSILQNCNWKIWRIAALASKVDILGPDCSHITFE